MTYSKHYGNDRKRREALIQMVGEGEIYDEFWIYNPKYGEHLKHIITTTGVIILKTMSDKVVTKYLARPGQIKRYYPYGDYPQDIVNLAIEYKKKGYNEVA